MRAILWSTILLLGIPSAVMAQAGGGAGLAGGASGGTAGSGALGGAGVAGSGFGGANSPAPGMSGATNAGAISGQTAAGPAAMSPRGSGLAIGNSSLGSNSGLANNPATPQTSQQNQALGQRSGQTLQGFGAAANATQGAIAAPGIYGGFFGVGQTAVTPNWGANSPPVAQPYQGSGINMPFTDQNYRNDGAIGGVGVAGSAAQQSMSGTGPANGSYQQANPQGLNLERWRFQRHDDLWWYYTPQRTWAVFQINQWVPYQRGALYARDNLANAQIAGVTDVQQRVTVGRPNYQGTGNFGAANYGPQARP